MKAKLQFVLLICMAGGLIAWAQGSSSQKKQSSPSATKTSASADWKAVDDAMGRAGQDQPD